MCSMKSANLQGTRNLQHRLGHVCVSVNAACNTVVFRVDVVLMASNPSSVDAGAIVAPESRPDSAHSSSMAQDSPHTIVPRTLGLHAVSIRLGCPHTRSIITRLRLARRHLAKHHVQCQSVGLLRQVQPERRSWSSKQVPCSG